VRPESQRELGNGDWPGIVDESPVVMREQVERNDQEQRGLTGPAKIRTSDESD
jgi:hypothetical protein